ncbi:MAG: ABC transporter permease, partial [Chloroflexota bacterium]
MARDVLVAPIAAPKLGWLDRVARFFDRYLLLAYTGFAVLYLMLPVFVIALFSVNDPIGRSNVAWRAFTLKYWLDPFGVPGLFDAVVTSLKIAVASTFVATMLGTLIALALVRYQFRGVGATNLLIFIPLAT